MPELILLLAAAVASGYSLRIIRPVRWLFDWAEVQFEGDGWDRWYRRHPAVVILAVAVLLHPFKARRALINNRAREQQRTEFNGAMRPKYDPNWTKEQT